MTTIRIFIEGNESLPTCRSSSFEADLIRVVSGDSVILYREGVTCRELLYSYAEKTAMLANIFYRASLLQKNLIFEVKTYNKKEDEINYILKNTVFGTIFYCTKEGWVGNKDGIIPHPVTYSSLFLILKYMNYFDPENINAIPMKILEAVARNHINIYKLDFIFSAWLLWIMFNKQFYYSTQPLFVDSTSYRPNGPGKFSYYPFLSILEFADLNNPRYKAADWWKKEEVKEQINKILNNHWTNLEQKKLLESLMEE